MYAATHTPSIANEGALSMCIATSTSDTPVELVLLRPLTVITDAPLRMLRYVCSRRRDLEMRSRAKIRTDTGKRRSTAGARRKTRRQPLRLRIVVVAKVRAA